MLLHYFTLALRNARRAPLAFAVNVLTLAVGLVCFIAAYAFAAFWQGAERHFANADRTHVLTMSYSFLDREVQGVANSPAAAAEALRADFSSLAAVARVMAVDGAESLVSSGEQAARLAAWAADPEFLDIFELPFVAGDAARALDLPRSVVLTQHAAAQLFGLEDALGKPLRIGNVVDATVTGVIAPVPEPSHLGRSISASVRFDLLTSVDVYEAIIDARLAARGITKPPAPSWADSNAITYLLLPRDGSFKAERLADELDEFAARRMPPPQQGDIRANVAFGLKPLTELLPNAADSMLFGAQPMSMSALLLALGTLILAVACVNYANLAAARGALRIREIGLRKALGARPANLVMQLLIETTVLTAAAIVVAVAVFRLAAPVFEGMVNADVAAALFEAPSVWPLLAAAVAAAAVVAGAYPAYALARLAPVTALRASRVRVGPKLLSTLLVGVQFAVASFLLIALAVSLQQNRFLERTGFGATEDPVLIVNTQADVSDVRPETLRAELAALPGVKSVTELICPPWQCFMLPQISDSPDPSSPARAVVYRAIGYDFFDLFGVELLAGRVFDPERDKLGGEGTPSVVLDRALAEALGFATPEDAVGEVIYFANNQPAEGAQRRSASIIGVVENKVFSIVESDFPPKGSYYGLQKDLPLQVVRVGADDLASALRAIDDAWKRLVPDVAIDREFLDEVFDRYYESFLRVTRVFGALALMAFAIAAAGLFGMASLIAGRRRQEIALRKTLGARTSAVAAMMLADFSKPVVIANLLAWPAAYLAVRAYLDVFVQSVPLTPLPFVASLAIAAGIAGVAVGAQTLQAARLRPADALRHE